MNWEVELVDKLKQLKATVSASSKSPIQNRRSEIKLQIKELWDLKKQFLDLQKKYKSSTGSASDFFCLFDSTMSTIKTQDHNAKKLLIANKEIQSWSQPQEQALDLGETCFRNQKEHLLMHEKYRLMHFMHSMGFKHFEAPVVDSIDNVFGRLNMGPDHPVFKHHNPLKIDSRTILRSHCTAFQPHFNETVTGENDEFYTFHIGDCYRNESDKTHAIRFSQLDIYFASPNGSLQTLKAIIVKVLEFVLGRRITLEIKGSHFPFTSLASYEGYIDDIEVVGFGVMSALSKSKFTHYAAGIGLDRLVAIKHQLSTIQDLK